MKEAEIIRLMCIIAKAHVEAAKFPSVTITPDAQAPRTMHLTCIDEDFNRDVQIDYLEQAAACMVSELQYRYGDDAEGLEDVPFDVDFPVHVEDDIRAGEF